MCDNVARMLIMFKRNATAPLGVNCAYAHAAADQTTHNAYDSDEKDQRLDGDAYLNRSAATMIRATKLIHAVFKPSRHSANTMGPTVPSAASPNHVDSITCITIRS